MNYTDDIADAIVNQIINTVEQGPFDNGKYLGDTTFRFPLENYNNYELAYLAQEIGFGFDVGPIGDGPYLVRGLCRFDDYALTVFVDVILVEATDED